VVNVLRTEKALLPVLKREGLFMGKLLIILLVLLAFTSNAHATLITNGDFETGKAGAATGWHVYTSIDGWSTVSGYGIEVQNNSVVTAQSGSHYVELDSHPRGSADKSTNSIMSQNVELFADTTYLLDFWYQARPGVSDESNAIFYGIENLFEEYVVPSSFVPYDIWTNIQYEFNIGTTGTYAVYFGAAGSANQLGGFIDNVTLNPVPEPSTLVLLGCGVLGLGWYARKRLKV